MTRLKPFKKEDAVRLSLWLSDEQVFELVCGGKYGEYPVSAEDILNYYNALSNAYPMTAFFEGRDVGHILIVKKSENVLLGSVVIDSAERGKGLGKKMLKEALKFSFENLKAREVTIGVFEQNLGALSLYKSLGFAESKKEMRSFLNEQRSYIWLKLKGENHEHL